MGVHIRLGLRVLRCVRRDVLADVRTHGDGRASRCDASHGGGWDSPLRPKGRGNETSPPPLMPSPGSCAPSSQDAFVLPSPTFRAVGIDRVSGLGVFFWDAGAAFAPIKRTDELPEL